MTRHMSNENINVGKDATAIVGGGAAGMMAACIISSLGGKAVIFEHNLKLGRKLAITGKGRCNLTNNCDINTFISSVPVNPRFLYGSLNAFTPSDTIAFFENLGVPLKTERGNRVFPISDRAYDIVDALVRNIKCPVINENVKKLILDENKDKIEGLETDSGIYKFKSVIICTGGKSYPLTGSTGDGYTLAKQAGLEVTELNPSLVPLEVEEDWCKHLMGLSLKNVKVEILDTVTLKTVYSDFGEMIFTHFGISGPITLSASAHICAFTRNRYKYIIDLKPALDLQTLDARILNDFSKYLNKNFINALGELLPQKIIPVVVQLTGVPPFKKVNSITHSERLKLIEVLKAFTLTIKGFRPIEEAVITSGGVSVKELNPKTMESKKVKGLYFAGEVIDIDAYTGGFNLQIAFSTANAAAKGVINQE